MKISEVTKNATITKDYSNVSFYHIGIPILCVTALLSLLLNFYILLSVKWISRKITPNLQITLSLAAVDSLTAALFITGYLLNSYLPIVFGLPMPTLNCFRLFLETLRVGAAITSVIHVLFLSMNQLISILYPLTYRTIITKRRIILLLIPGWICPFLCLNFIFISYPGQGYRSNTCFSRFLVEFKYRITIFLIVMIPFTAIVVTHVILVFLLRQVRFSLQ